MFCRSPEMADGTHDGICWILEKEVWHVGRCRDAGELSTRIRMELLTSRSFFSL